MANKRILLIIKGLLEKDDIECFWEMREMLLRGGGRICMFVCRIIRRRYGSGIPISLNINRFHTPHGFYGIFISKDAMIGKNCTVFQQVTIGSNTLLSKSRGVPVIGDNVIIGAGAKIIGNVKVGNNVRISANAIVVVDVPDNATVVMKKPRIILHEESRNN